MRSAIARNCVKGTMKSLGEIGFITRVSSRIAGNDGALLLGDWEIDAFGFSFWEKSGLGRVNFCVFGGVGFKFDNGLAGSWYYLGWEKSWNRLGQSINQRNISRIKLRFK